MAIERPLLDKIMLLAAKLETTNGTAISVSATDADHLVYGFDYSPDAASAERPLNGSMGSDVSIPGAQTGTVRFNVQLAGKGSVSAVPPWADRFLPACGYTKTGSQFDRAVTGQTLTIAWFEDGLKNIFYGAAGTFKLSGTTSQPAEAMFEFKGLHLSETDVSIISPTFPSVLPPIWAGSTTTIASYTPVLSKFEIDAGNQIEYRPDQAAAGGIRCALIVNHLPKLTIDPEATLVATRNWDSIYRAMTEEAFSLSLGSVSNNTITIAASKAQSAKPQRNVRGGIIARSITAQLNGATPLSIAFS